MPSLPHPPARYARRFETAILSNGTPVHLAATETLKVSTVALVWTLPLDSETTDRALLWSVLRRGCRGAPSLAAISNRLDDLYGAGVSSDCLKLGETHVLEALLEVPSDCFLPGGAHALDRSLAFLRDLVYRPVTEGGGLRRDYVEQERLNSRRFLEGLRNDKAEYAGERARALMCAGEPFARYENGAMEELDCPSGESLADLHDRLARTAPQRIYAVGDFPPAKALAAIGRHFDRPRARSIDLPPVERRPAPDSPRVVTERFPVEQAKLVCGYRTPIDVADPRYPALAMWNGCFGGFSHARLFREVREAHGFAYAIHSAVEPVKGLVEVDAGVEPPHVEEALALIADQHAALSREGPTADERSQTLAGIEERIGSLPDAPRRWIHAHLTALLGGTEFDGEAFLAGCRSADIEAIRAAGSTVRLDTVYRLLPIEACDAS